ncbi:putative N-acetyltransferase 8B [Takifugu flavidus]|uniref:Putative N-acetyltransferase 8B n=1 Tax=Takifugu flavidus TaxID=433684 RepID=A0A5C6N6D2_9TELE|nr:putative N-acetyltransferase 8B [Takifugu flavidus]
MWQQKRNVRKTVNAETELMGRPREHPRDFESPENGLVLKERAYWKKQLHELQQKCDKLGRQVFYAEQHNRDLNDKLQQVKELNKKKDEEIVSQQQQLDLRKGFNQTGGIQDELNGVDEQPNKVHISLQTGEIQDELNGVDEQPNKVHISLQTGEIQDELNGVDEQPKKVDIGLQTLEIKDELNGVDEQPKKVDIGLQTVEIQDELNGVDEQPMKVDIGLQIKIPLNDINDSQELQNSEGSLEEEVGQPREVLPEREEQFREKSLRSEAHVDTLALLTQTEAALRESEEKSSRLEKALQVIVAEQGEKQLSRKEESVSTEPCGPDNTAINQLYDLCDHWENIINQMIETEKKVHEEKKEETRLQQEIQHLHVEKVQLQLVIRKYRPSDRAEVHKLFSTGMLEHIYPCFYNAMTTPLYIFITVALSAAGVLLGSVLGALVLPGIWVGFIFYCCHQLYSRVLQAKLQTDMQDITRSYLSRPDDCFWVAEAQIDGTVQIVGTVAVLANQKEGVKQGELTRLSTSPSFRRMGLGSILTHTVIDFCKERGFSELVLQTSAIRTAAVNLYKKLGFHIVLTLSQSRPREDGAKMRRQGLGSAFAILNVEHAEEMPLLLHFIASSTM